MKNKEFKDSSKTKTRLRQALTSLDKVKRERLRLYRLLAGVVYEQGPVVVGFAAAAKVNAGDQLDVVYNGATGAFTIRLIGVGNGSNELGDGSNATGLLHGERDVDETLLRTGEAVDGASGDIQPTD